MNRLLLFDVDGTLVDSGGAGRDALRRALLSVFGETGPIDSFPFAGKTDPAIVRGLMREAGLPGEEVDRGLGRLWRAYLEALPEELDRRKRDGRLAACPGVLRLLESAAADPRFSLALVTGNVAGGAWRKLEAAGAARHFAFGAFGSDSARREELPAIALSRAARRLGREFGPDDAVVIGDTPQDVRCARIAGTRSVAVATGRFGTEELAEHAPDHLFRDFTETAAVLEAMGTGAPEPS